MRLIRPLSLAMGAVLMTACATTNSLSPDTTTDTTNSKNTLSKAFKSQLYSSFSYQTHAYVSNHIRRDATQKIELDIDDANCDEAHDIAYIALLKNAKKDGLSIDNEQYSVQRDAIKDTYLTCLSIQQSQTNYKPFDFDDFYEQSKGLDEDSQAKLFIQHTNTHINEQALQVDSPSIDKTSHTKLDAKKAKLIDEYLLKPTTISIMGRYEPLKGHITALPMISYHAKNLSASINQPLYIDLKAGGIYLWADNLALANSQAIDKQLGDKWYNKWLFIPLNDGSLPADFSKDFIKAYFEAKKESFGALPDGDFDRVSYAEFNKLPFVSQNLPPDTLALIGNTPHIIQHQTTNKDKAYSNYVFASTLYHLMTEKYPELSQQVNFYERDIVEGESVIAITDVTNDSKSKSNDQPLVINSKFLMNMLFDYLKNTADDYATNTQLKSSQYTPITHYGINNGKISWLHYRHYLTYDPLNKFDQMSLSADEPLFIDVFTQIHQNSKAVNEFGRLPITVQAPNANNSVNLFDYQQDLVKRLKDGDDKYLQMMMGLLLGSQQDDILQPDKESPTDKQDP